MRERITPREILEAYERTGFTPIRHNWLVEIEGENSACGLTALAYTIEPTIPSSYWGNHGFQTCEKILELDGWYCEGFADGFDGRNIVSRTWKVSTKYFEGFDDGLAAWQAVRHLAAGEDE